MLGRWVGLFLSFGLPAGAAAQGVAARPPEKATDHSFEVSGSLGAARLGGDEGSRGRGPALVGVLGFAPTCATSAAKRRAFSACRV